MKRRNMMITLVSVLVAVLIGGIEALGLLQDRLHLRGQFWGLVARLNGNFNGLGFMIIGLFIAAWIASVMIYRYKGYEHIEVRALPPTTTQYGAPQSSSSLIYRENARRGRKSA